MVLLRYGLLVPVLIANQLGHAALEQNIIYQAQAPDGGTTLPEGGGSEVPEISEDSPLNPQNQDRTPTINKGLYSVPAMTKISGTVQALEPGMVEIKQAGGASVQYTLTNETEYEG